MPGAAVEHEGLKCSVSMAASLAAWAACGSCGGTVPEKTEVLPGRSRGGTYAVLCRPQLVVQMGLRFWAVEL